MLRTRSAAAAALLALTVASPAALAHGGGSPNYISKVEEVTPEGAGMRATVLERDDRLLLRASRTGTVTVEGYNGEPYARVRGDGTVEVNRRSPALYLNRDREGESNVPSIADEHAAPDWDVKDRSGRFEWHDHRMHWMGSRRPEKVRDPDVRTRIFDWRVPIRVDGRRGAIAGRLDWVPTGSVGIPAAGWLVGAAGLVALGGLALAVRRHRRTVREDQAEVW